MRDVVNAGALELIEATVLAGSSGQSARKWWMGELSRTAKEQETALEDMAVTPAQIAELQGWWTPAGSPTSWPGRSSKGSWLVKVIQKAGGCCSRARGRLGRLRPPGGVWTRPGG